MNLLAKHKRYFPDIDSLYDYQAKVFDLLASGKNTLAIIPTGGGKSLLYQLTAIDRQGLTLVISPLVALMNEQVNELNNKRAISSLALNANISFNEQRRILRELGAKGFKLIYVSPERLQNPFFRAALLASGIKISLIVVDEAHCISQWGGGFRPDYSEINTFINWLGNQGQKPQTLCLTATLSKKAAEDIATAFCVENSHIFRSKDIIRRNLELTFKKVEQEKDKVGLLIEFIRKNNIKKGIAYLYSRRESENYSKKISEAIPGSAFYHANISSENKQIVYDEFLKGSINILFATTAFGMGINIPDIDAVIHVHIPNSIEEYYQQAGRGWRDKKIDRTCYCLALFSEVNFKRRREEIEKEKVDADVIRVAFRKLIGNPKKLAKGDVISKDKDAIISSEDQLQLLRYKLERVGILTTIGEINGSPLSIELKKPTGLWKQIQEKAEYIDSFLYVSKELGITISSIIGHLYEQELKGNISKLPAMKRDVFMTVNEVELLDSVANQIVAEINSHIDFRLQQLDELKYLFTSGHDANQIIRASFGL